MSTMKIEKVLALPTSLVPNTMYLVQTNGTQTFDIHITNSAGNITFALNKADIDYDTLTNLPDLSKKANLVDGKVPKTELSLSASDISYISTEAVPATNVTEAISILLNMIGDNPVSASLGVNAALVTDTNGMITAHPAVSSTELGYLESVTSNIQDQLNDKQATIELAANSLVVTDAQGHVVASSTITLEMLNALVGISTLKTIQEQLDSKLSAVPPAGSPSVVETITVPTIPGVTTTELTLEEVITDTLTTLQTVATTGEIQW